MKYKPISLRIWTWIGNSVFYDNNCYTHIYSDEDTVLFFYFTNPMERIWKNVNFYVVSAGLNSEFSFSRTSCFTKVKWPFYLPIAGDRRDGSMPFPRLLAWREMQTVLSRIWTPVSDFVSYDNNLYTKCASTRYFFKELLLKHVPLIDMRWYVNIF